MSKSTVVALTGGGAHGIWQAGAFEAVINKGIKYDALVATSVGSLNGAAVHGGSVISMLTLWSKFHNSDVFRWAPLKPFTPDGCLFDSTPLKNNIQKYIDFKKLLLNTCPFLVNVTIAGPTGWKAAAIDLSKLSITDATMKYAAEIILASASIPVAFPPVHQGMDILVDGGLTNNYGIVPAIEHGAEHIIVLRPTKPSGYQPKNMVDMIALATAIPAESTMDKELDYARAKGIEVTLIEPVAPLPFGLLDFDGMGDAEKRKSLMQQGYDTTMEALQKVKV